MKGFPAIGELLLSYGLPHKVASVLEPWAQKRRVPVISGNWLSKKKGTKAVKLIRESNPFREKLRMFHHSEQEEKKKR
uniref:Uncharacterized protein n=1 Tax=Cannabis sativa TaxID=3483 RepID=A0A803PVD2_CANSA